MHSDRDNQFDSRQLETIFDTCFSDSFNTCLRGGCDEPLYQPATDEQSRHTLYYREDYFASALHEISHWCIAGQRRRLLVDFGYWYIPDGRDANQQAAFEQVEVKPQALEYLFSRACGYRFRISADNLSGEAGSSTAFASAVYAQVLDYCRCALPDRAQSFFTALAQAYGQQVDVTQLVCEPEDFGL